MARISTRLNQIVLGRPDVVFMRLDALVRAHGKDRVADVLADLIGDMADSGRWDEFDTERAERMMKYLLSTRADSKAFRRRKNPRRRKARRNALIHTPMTLTQQQGFTVHEGGGIVHELPDEKVVWLEVTSSSGEPGRVYVRSVLDRYGSWSAVEGVFYGDEGGGDDPSDLPAWVTRRKWTRYM